MTQLTYREAARRVGRSPRAIRRWRHSGMPMGWEVRDGQRCRVVEEQTLLRWWRQRLKNDPVHQQRMRKLLDRETAAQDATRPDETGS